MYSTESDFYLRQRQEDRRWGIAAAVAVSLHAAVVLLVLFSPSLFETKPIVEEVVSVSLVAMGDAGEAAPPAAAGGCLYPVVPA